MKDPEFLAFLGALIAALRAHPLFSGPWPDIYPSLDEMEKEAEGFRTLYNGSLTKDIVITSQKNAARKVLNKKIFQISQYVELVAGEDPVKLMGTGFTLKGHSVRHIRAYTVPQGFKLSNGLLPGSVNAKCARMDGVAAWEIYAADDPSREENFRYVSNFTRCSHMEMTGFESVKKFYFKIRAIGHDVKGPWSPVVSIVVL